MSQIIVKRRTERDTFSPIHGAEEVRKETSTHVSHLRCLSRSRRLGSQAAKGRMFLTWQTVSRSQSRDQGSRIARQMEMGFLSLMPFPFQTSVRPLCTLSHEGRDNMAASYEGPGMAWNRRAAARTGQNTSTPWLRKVKKCKNAYIRYQ